MRWLSGSLSFTKLDDIPLVLSKCYCYTILVLFFNKRLEIIELGEESNRTWSKSHELKRLVNFLRCIFISFFYTSITGPIACISFLAGPILKYMQEKRSPIKAGGWNFTSFVIRHIFSKYFLR